jgi:ATPase subunit of ABC transporter with duplicated ATPase domains
MSVKAGSILGSTEEAAPVNVKAEAPDGKRKSSMISKVYNVFNRNKGPVYRKNLAMGQEIKEPLMRTTGLSVRLGEKGQSERLLNGVTFEMNEGEKIGIFGPSASGKTSLLRVLAGQSQPVGGTFILKEGLKVDILDPSRIEFNPHKSAIKQFTDQEHMMIGSTYTSVSNYLEEFGLSSNCFDVPYKDLTQSEKLYLSLSVLMLEPPDIWIMDNWFEGLDLESLILLEDFMINFKGGMVFASEDRWILEKLSKQAVCLSPLPHGSVEAKLKDAQSPDFYDFADLNLAGKFPEREKLHFEKTVMFGAQQRQDVDELMLVNRLKKLKAEYEDVTAKIKSQDPEANPIELSRRSSQLEKQIKETEDKIVEQKKKLSI